MKKLTHKTLFDHLDSSRTTGKSQSAGLATVYLFTGEELYFADRALAVITERALAGAPRDFNFDVFYGKDSKAAEIAAQASTLPMMADKRLVVLKEADKLRDMGELKEYLKSPSPDCVLILLAMGADRSKERTLSELLPDDAVYVHFWRPRDYEIPDLVQKLVRASGFTIDRGAVVYLAETLSGNLALIEAELNKVFNLLGERRQVKEEDVKEAVGDFGLPAVFELADAAAAKDASKAIETLEKLLRDGEEPLKLLAILAGHWRKMAAGDERSTGGAGGRKAPARKMSEDEAARAFNCFMKADRDLKGSPVPPRLVVERLLMELSGAV
ncbi:MAG: DNA polymerase III subunit delta [Nitrospirota bacterium]